MGSETSNLPIGPATVLAIVAYVAVSLYGGQFIAERRIALSGWIEDCASVIQAEMQARRKPRAAPPKQDQNCGSTIGAIFPEARPYCDLLDNLDLGAAADRAGREAENRARALQNKRLERAAANAPSQCACAASVYRQDKMVPLAIHAGTARLVTPHAVEAMDQELRIALGSPVCGGDWEGRS